MGLRSKLAQIDLPIATFIVVMIGVIIMSPFILKIFNSFVKPFGEGLASVSPMANQSAQHVVMQVNNFWDFGIAFVFLIVVIMMFVSAYFIDVHPLFIVFYIILAFILFLILTPMQSAFTELYATGDLANETANLPVTNFIATNFWVICLIMYVVTGIIMYGKLRAKNVW